MDASDMNSTGRPKASPAASPSIVPSYLFCVVIECSGRGGLSSPVVEIDRGFAQRHAICRAGEIVFLEQLTKRGSLFAFLTANRITPR
jgi:hypothetical protein